SPVFCSGLFRFAGLLESPTLEDRVDVHFTPPGEGLPGRCGLKATGEETRGAALAEGMSPLEGTPLHVHEREEEAWLFSKGKSSSRSAIGSSRRPPARSWLRRAGSRTPIRARDRTPRASS